MTSSHRHHLARGYRTCSENYGVVEYLQEKYILHQVKYTKLKHIVHLRREIQVKSVYVYILESDISVRTCIFSGVNSAYVYILWGEPGTKPGCLGHTRVSTCVPPEYIPYRTHPSFGFRFGFRFDFRFDF